MEREARGCKGKGTGPVHKQEGVGVMRGRGVTS